MRSAHGDALGICDERSSGPMDQPAREAVEPYCIGEF